MMRLDDLEDRIEAIEASLARIEAMLAGGGNEIPNASDRRVKRRVYPWDQLEADGEFFWPCLPAERAKVQLSICANANKRYGAGVVSAKRVKGGVKVRRKS